MKKFSGSVMGQAMILKPWKFDAAGQQNLMAPWSTRQKADQMHVLLTIYSCSSSVIIPVVVLGK